MIVLNDRPMVLGLSDHLSVREPCFDRAPRFHRIVPLQDAVGGADCELARC